MCVHSKSEVKSIMRYTKHKYPISDVEAKDGSKFYSFFQQILKTQIEIQHSMNTDYTHYELHYLALTVISYRDGSGIICSDVIKLLMYHVYF